VSGPDAPRRAPRARPARGAPPQRLDVALRPALGHARSAAGEAALAVRALLDAASLGATGVPAEGHEALRGALRWLETLAESAGGSEGRRWLQALAAALDGEIARWEARSQADPEARGVLRAFLGLRELLWELGLRAAPAEPPSAAPAPTATPTGQPAPGARRPRPAPRAPARRLERVPIDGGGPPGRPG
jgi:hypothetical protein